MARPPVTPPPIHSYMFAGLDTDAGRLERAVRLAGAAASMSENTGTRVWPVIQRESDAWLGLARATLGEAFLQTWTQGKTLTREQAAAYALERKPPDPRS